MTDPVFDVQFRIKQNNDHQCKAFTDFKQWLNSDNQNKSPEKKQSEKQMDGETSFKIPKTTDINEKYQFWEKYNIDSEVEKVEQNNIQTCTSNCDKQTNENTIYNKNKIFSKQNNEANKSSNIIYNDVSKQNYIDDNNVKTNTYTDISNSTSDLNINPHKNSQTSADCEKKFVINDDLNITLDSREYENNQTMSIKNLSISNNAKEIKKNMKPSDSDLCTNIKKSNQNYLENYKNILLIDVPIMNTANLQSNTSSLESTLNITPIHVEYELPIHNEFIRKSTNRLRRSRITIEEFGALCEPEILLNIQNCVKSIGAKGVNSKNLTEMNIERSSSVILNRFIKYFPKDCAIKFGLSVYFTFLEECVIYLNETEQIPVLINIDFAEFFKCYKIFSDFLVTPKNKKIDIKHQDHYSPIESIIFWQQAILNNYDIRIVQYFFDLAKTAIFTKLGILQALLIIKAAIGIKVRYDYMQLQKIILKIKTYNCSKIQHIIEETLDEWDKLIKDLQKQGLSNILFTKATGDIELKPIEIKVL